MALLISITIFDNVDSVFKNNIEMKYRLCPVATLQNSKPMAHVSLPRQVGDAGSCKLCHFLAVANLDC